LTSKIQTLQERQLVFDPTSAKGNRWPPHRTPIRIKVPLNVSVAELLVWVQLLKADYFGLGHAEPPRREPGGASSERQKC